MRRFTIIIPLILLLFSMEELPAKAPSQQPLNITRISVSTDGHEGNGDSEWPALSADGRFVAFQSWASNLVPGDTNNAWDIFVHDRLTGETIRVSVASDGTQANGKSEYPSISADGRYITFQSMAANLVPESKHYYKTDIFVHDRLTHKTVCASVASSGAQSNGNSKDPSISADGRFVAFTSVATNLTPNIRNSNYANVFVHDQSTNETIRASLASNGKEGNDSSGNASIRTNGRFITFASAASNLAPGDTNGKIDVFVHDLKTGETKRISLASDGTQGNGNSARPRISLDGDFVVFTSDASNLVSNDTNNSWDIFFHDFKTGKTDRVSVNAKGEQADGNSTRPRLNRGDGRFVVFSSEATNLLQNDTNKTWDIFVRDRETSQTARVSMTYDGKEGNNASDFPAVSNDGKFIAFDSWASNLIEGDNNNTKDVFVINNPLAEL